MNSLLLHLGWCNGSSRHSSWQLPGHLHQRTCQEAFCGTQHPLLQSESGNRLKLDNAYFLKWINYVKTWIAWAITSILRTQRPFVQEKWKSLSAFRLQHAASHYSSTFLDKRLHWCRQAKVHWTVDTYVHTHAFRKENKSKLQTII